MSHFGRVCAALVCLAAFGGTAALATADGPDYFSITGVAADDGLNIRTAPAVSGARIGVIPADGDGIANLGCVGGLTMAEWDAATEAERAASAKTRWCRIGYDRTVGWVAGWFLTESGSDEDQFRAGGRLGQMAGSEWLLRDFAGEAPAAEAWIGFRADNAVGGSAGCNSFNGTFMPGEDAPLFSPMAATRKMCPPAQMETETRVFQVLGAAQQIVAYHLVMTLFDADGTVLATFTRRDAD